jgi:hypothetical protein
MGRMTLVCGRCRWQTGNAVLEASPVMHVFQAVDDGTDQAALMISRKRLLYRSRETGLLEADLILVRSV